MRARRSFLLLLPLLVAVPSGCSLVIDGRLNSLRDGGGPEEDAFVPVDAGPPDAPMPDAYVPSCDGVSCGANEHCDIVDDAPLCVCDTGYEGAAGACVDVDECATGALTCDASSICRNDPGTAHCACLPGTSGDPCTPATVLAWTDADSSGPVTSAITAAGLLPSVHTDTDFAAAFDAGGFDLVIVASATNLMPPEVQSRVEGWAATGRLILLYYDLDAQTTLQSTLGFSTSDITTTGAMQFSGTQPNLFEQAGRAASPVTPTDFYFDDGDRLFPTVGGALSLAGFTSLGGSAILKSGSVPAIVNGFVLPTLTGDIDGDSLTDGTEILVNEIDYLMRPRVLTYYDDFVPGTPPLFAAIAALGWTRIESGSPAMFPGAYAAGGFDLIAIQSGSNYLDDTFQTRLFDWVGMDPPGPALFSYWDLDGSDMPTAVFRNALQVSTVTRPDATAIVRDPGSPVDLFRLRQTLPDTVTPISDAADNGDELTPTAGGTIAARFESDSGPNAIAITRDGAVVVNGFLPADFQQVDADGDGLPDMQELYENELVYLMAR